MFIKKKLKDNFDKLLNTIKEVVRCDVCDKEFKAKGLAKRCSPECRKSYMKEYYQRPETKAMRKLYHQWPEMKVWKEVKAYHKEYRQRPEVQARIKEYHQKLSEMKAMR